MYRDLYDKIMYMYCSDCDLYDKNMYMYRSIYDSKIYMYWWFI